MPGRILLGGPVSRVELKQMPEINKNMHVREQNENDTIDADWNIEIIQFYSIEHMIKEADTLLRYL